MARYVAWLKESRGLSFACYNGLRHCFTHDLEAFWSSIWDFFDLQSSNPYSRVLARNTMPGAVWLPGSSLNFSDQVLLHTDSLDEQPAIIMQSEPLATAPSDRPSLPKKLPVLRPISAL